MAVPVYFANLRSRNERETKQIKIQKLFDSAFGGVVQSGDLTALKLHFGEIGNDTYLSPLFVRTVVERVRSLGSRPFVTDTNTLYGGGRANSVDHINTAVSHGFAYAVLGAPIIIADGLRSNNYVDVPIDKNHFQSVKIAGDIHQADSMIVLSHFKGHLLSGFGGAIKNLGMGCAPAEGKAEQHSTRPLIYKERCQGCGRCVEACSHSAISLVDKVATIDLERCLGCGECLRICRQQAIDFDWMVQVPPFLERMAEYAWGAVADKKDRVGYMTFLMNITPDCDCIPWSDAPMVPDIGILASRDPVAIDRAAYDLVNAQQGFKNSFLKSHHAPGQDKFKGVWEHTDA
ncbi:MAG: DUF362 domain-containing protein, partial [Methanosarcinales archaeon]|nr:DUF362 domain-containing protein [Methanosarcinales archaeon]